ncbi:MAG: multiple sugar transport system permease protein, partial [Gaiellales bacterium]|nr:multiple sugar transport system permease protein [Gaiellales bacterium]
GIRRREVPKGLRRRRLLLTVANHAILIAVSFAFLMPVLFMLMTALMTDEQALSQRLIPSPVMWENFRTIFDKVDLVHYTWNTFLYAGLSTLGVVISCIPVAYVFARLQWRGRNLVFLLVLSTLMLPTQVTTISLYVIFAKHMDWTGVQWVGTLKPLIVPSFFGDAFSIFLLRQFFMTIPQELSDAVRVDGGGDLQVIRQVIIPLAKPAIAAVALFNFIYAWNNFYDVLVWVGENPDAQTLSLALSQFQTLHHVEWNLTMAASVIFMLPVIVIFFLAQRVFIEGVTLTGVKG